MDEHLRIVCCANLGRETGSVLSDSLFKGCGCKTCPVECDQSEGRWPGLGGILAGVREAGLTPVVVGGYCLMDEGGTGEGPGRAVMLRKGQCLDWLLDPYIMDIFQRDGKFFLLPGWVENWEVYAGKFWEGGRRTARDYFAGLGRRAVLADTGLYPEIQDKMKAFAKYIQMPFETFPAGLELFRMNLSAELMSLKLGWLRRESEEAAGAASRRAVRFVGLESIMKLDAESEGEEFGGRVLEFLREVLTPASVSFFPAGILEQTRIAPGSPLEQVALLDADHAWDEGSGSLMLRLGSGPEFRGVIEVAGIPAGLRDEFLALSLAVMKAAGSALERSRLTDELNRERARTEKAREALLDSENRMRAVFDGAPIGLYRATPQGLIVDANPAFAAMTGFPDVAALKTINYRELYAEPDLRSTGLSLIEAEGMLKDFEYRMRRRDGGVIWVRETARAVRDASGKSLFFDGAVEDVTRKKQAESYATWIRGLQESMTGLYGRILRHGTIEDISLAVMACAVKMTSSRTAAVGYVDRTTGRMVLPAMTEDAAALCGSRPGECPDFHGLSGMFREAMSGTKPLVVNAPEAYRKAGRPMPEGHFPVERLIIAPAAAGEDLMGVVVAANSDHLYSEQDEEAMARTAEAYAIAVLRYRQRQELKELSLVDELTKLYNRRGFMALAQQQIKMVHRTKRDMMLLYADLDDLKVINDTYGHNEGDLALVETAAILRSAFRDSDIIARIGGDEFVVLAIEAVEKGDEAIYARVENRVAESNSRPGCKFPLSLSCGVVRYQAGSQASIESLIAEADALMYEKKGARKSRKGAQA